MRRGLRVLLGWLDRKRLPDTVRLNSRIRCTKCALDLMTRLASRVVRGAPVMMMMMMMIIIIIISTKALLVA